ncbi:Rrf2 family transcriptional regulator [Alloscardovia theropitheci]|uniref:Rrf2 family transcriptional regulator n=1 Tax=Alloscardovia theropitheci TaxID=2496842 RepID=A0A4R0QT30_9BIFI|nr:Rrf2 family transcriptional regulator [Alloscardovia theropitheci]TCD54658.1 Rrf2 family transcriptional regulator [Alloscardovia theropitheci]
MQITSRFTVAIHALAFIDLFQDKMRVTSAVLARSTQVNPVIIRTVLSKLKEAGVVDARRGSGGFRLAKPLTEVTFYDVYAATDTVDKTGLFHFHDNPHPDCVVGGNIHAALDGSLVAVQKSMEDEMKKISVEDIVNNLRHEIQMRGQSIS